ncbi:hypothetical protein SAPIO_CDS6889 [Scedosporium apiospermum]|uniref:Uncharacterized protein n=1 Tax=Pseudallescheria apiosperma TaxID=563466 RepID=A0A084G2Z6_PSEDA|nr:uncharacterized protein SAPIO_CDS6889 [Scedosporium apiospermum]KEZ41708.1 hypothetical protein SAPIO_CDS6889 [Scedosporium apiospermum]
MNPSMKLSAPVILRQRRPKTRARGFIRAYAPVLDDVGIDQETFFDFIDTFNEALEPNPWLYSFNLADLAGLAVPEPLMMLLGIGVGIATDAAIETQSRFKSNKFLVSINADFFLPRGLLCLVVTRKPEAAVGELITTVDFEGRAVESQTKATTSFNQKIRDIITKASSSDKELQKSRGQIQDRMKSSSGAYEWPEPAALIFPSPGEAGSAQRRAVEGNKKKKNALDRAESWLDEYMDRYAQAKWLEKNHGHPTASFAPKPEFRSRYADPSHPAASGDPVAFLTGGKWQFGREKIVENRPPGRDRNGKDLKPGSASLEAKSSSSGSAPAGRFINLLQRDVLCLLIVDVTSSRIDGFEGSGDSAVA